MRFILDHILLPRHSPRRLQLIRKKKLGLPKDSTESFLLLVEADILDKEFGKRLKGMVGFRNILVHEYTELDLTLMVDVIEHHLDEPIEFAQRIVEQFKEGE